jgi:DNA-binding NarL/FixJ family response regulator
MSALASSSVSASLRPVGRHVFSESAWLAVARALRLSPREMQIVCGIFDDRKEEAIAAEIQVSPHTVHTHVQRLYHKLGVSSRVDLAVRLMAEHIACQQAGGKSAEG